MKRRTFLKNSAGLAAGLLIDTELRGRARAQSEKAQTSGSAIIIDPKPLFEQSPNFFMQFMEPLGVADSSVEAAWSYDTDNWRKDFIETTKDLAPDVVRYGGLFSRFYKWREGVGRAEKRPWMRNYVWGGKETNRVGTHEFVDFCRRVGAAPFYCVNFLSDGRQIYSQTREGNRTGDAAEAADWVSYANDPDNAVRRAHGHSDPYNIRLWQLGNETSYGKGGFTRDQSINATIEFAKAMRARDRSLQLIGWGDDRWAGELSKRAGEFIDYVAVHMMQQTPQRENTVLNSLAYQDHPEQAWEELMALIPARIERKLLALESELDANQSKLPIAITEGHLSLSPHNVNPILTEWLTGVYHARALNLYQRHGARVHICTAADFNGSRWTTNALMHQVPVGISYLLPAGAVMRLFKRYNGSQGIAVKSGPDSLDIAASRTADKIYLHVANMNYTKDVEAAFAVDGMAVLGGQTAEIAPERPRQEAGYRNPDIFKPVERSIEAKEPVRWRFPARSVTAVTLDCKSA